MSLYSIGQVSSLIDLPVKTIRYYESIGLCAPSQTDERSGYRYYSMEDIFKLDLIKCLGKQLGMPLKTIKKYIEMSNDPETLKRYLRELEGEIDAQIEQQLLRRSFLATKLEAIIRRELVRPLEPEFKWLPRRTIFVTQITVDSQEDAMLRVRRLASGAGGAYERELYLLRDGLNGCGSDFSGRTVTVGLDVPGEENPRRLVLESGIYAQVYYPNRVAERGEALEKLVRFIREQSLSARGPLIFRGTLIDATSVSSRDYYLLMQTLV